jgi:glycine cleavage system H protein
MTTRYTREHEWIRLDGEIGTIGISDYAQEQLGDVVYVELPEIGKSFDKGAEAAVVESVKAASEIFAPVAGEVVEVNTKLDGEPGMVNASPESDGWFMKIKVANAADINELMDADAYQAFLETI